MAIQAGTPIIPARKDFAGATPMIMAPQKSSASFAIGAPVEMSAGNIIAIAGTASEGTGNTLTGMPAGKLRTVIGLAAGPATSSATSSVGIIPLREGMEFRGHLIHGTAASAKAAVSRLMNISASGGIVRLAKQTSSDTHWGWALDASSTFTSPASIVAGVITEFIDAASTVNGRVNVRITKGGALAAL